jgi:hypothetical protein
VRARCPREIDLLRRHHRCRRVVQSARSPLPPAARPHATTRSPPPADLLASLGGGASRSDAWPAYRDLRRDVPPPYCLGSVRWAAPVHDAGGAASSNGRTDARRADMGTQESQPSFRQCAPYVAFVLFMFLSVGFVRSRRWLSTHGTRAPAGCNTFQSRTTDQKVKKRRVRFRYRVSHGPSFLCSAPLAL